MSGRLTFIHLAYKELCEPQRLFSQPPRTEWEINKNLLEFYPSVGFQDKLLCDFLILSGLEENSFINLNYI